MKQGIQKLGPTRRRTAEISGRLEIQALPTPSVSHEAQQPVCIHLIAPSEAGMSPAASAGAQQKSGLAGISGTAGSVGP